MNTGTVVFFVSQFSRQHPAACNTHKLNKSAAENTPPQMHFLLLLYVISVSETCHSICYSVKSQDKKRSSIQ